jgi:hypothetical protein
MSAGLVQKLSSPCDAALLPEYALEISVKAERTVALGSADHLHPHGTRQDNSRNPRFNRKMYDLFPELDHTLTILDIGCSGGGFVRDCLNDGCVAVGLEGSDYSQKRHRAEWAVIPQYLFVCDVTAPFEVTIRAGANDRPKQLECDVVTSWELIEHISERDLPIVAKNVRSHLRPGGLWIMSVSPHADLVNLALHQTVRPREWWIRTFAGLGFQNLDAYVRYFNTQFVRGPKYGAAESFHLVLSTEPHLAPPIPRVSLKQRTLDLWIGSRVHHMLQRLIIG